MGDRGAVPGYEAQAPRLSDWIRACETSRISSDAASEATKPTRRKKGEGKHKGRGFDDRGAPAEAH